LNQVYISPKRRVYIFSDENMNMQINYLPFHNALGLEKWVHHMHHMVSLCYYFDWWIKEVSCRHLDNQYI